MSDTGWGILVVSGCAALTVLLTRPVLGWLREPPDAANQRKIPYRELGSTTFVLGCAVLSAGAALLAWSTVPRSTVGLWCVLAVPTLILVAIDARTTWLPLQLTRVCWAAMAAATPTILLLGGATADVVRLLLGAAAATGFYGAVWAFSRGAIGFGDVRLAPLIGAATAAVSWQLALWAVLLGSILGGLAGLVMLALRRTGPFPYGPAMLGGAFAATALQWLLSPPPS